MQLTVRHIRHWYEPKLPHAVFLDGLFAGMMQGDRLQIEVPPGIYNLRVQCGGRLPIGKSGRSIDLSLSSTVPVTVQYGSGTVCEFHDRERLWNLLFDADLVAWLVSLFVTMPPLYKILANAFFVIWLVRLFLIRKRYYKITFRTSNSTSAAGW